MVITAAYQLKGFYRQAGTEQLAWIIGPTAWVTELFSGLSFTPEPGYGWVDTAHNVVIAPVCAGVNFLIIAFCMSAFQILWKKRSLKALTIGIILAGLASYLLTICANAIRIILASTLFNLDIYNEWLTPDMMHRIAGTVVYYLLLYGHAQVINWGVSVQNNRGRVRENPFGTQMLLLIPLFWYLLFTVCVPFANDSLRRDPEMFLRHAATVGAVTLVLTLIFHLVHRCFLCVRNNRYSSIQCNVSSHK